MPALFTFICGSDDFIVSRNAAEQWSEMTVSVTDDFALEIIDGSANNVAEVEEVTKRFISALQTMPMFGDHKYVWLKDVTFLADSQTGKAEGTKSQVVYIQESLERVNPSDMSVLVSASPVDRRRKEFKWFEKTGDTRFVGGDKNDPAAGIQMVQVEADKLGLDMERGALEFLMAKINANVRLAIEELHKLENYIGGPGLISTQLVNEMVPSFGEGDFFEAAEAFYTLNLKETLNAIHRHFFSGYDIRPLLSALQNRNRLLLQLRVLMDGGYIGPRVSKQDLERAAEAQKDAFGDAQDKGSFNIFTQNPWYLGRLAETARRLNMKRLIDFQMEFVRAFEEVIGRPSEQEAVMRETAVRCLG
jgi:DNA polymerase-3 subunit delta